MPQPSKEHIEATNIISRLKLYSHTNATSTNIDEYRYWIEGVIDSTITTLSQLLDP